MTIAPAEEPRDHRFLMGLIAGAVLGVGAGMLLAPRAALNLRGRLTGSAKSLGSTASEGYHQVSARVGAVAKEYKTKGQAVRDSLAETVVRGAQRVEQYATEAKTNHDDKVSEHSVA
jgi:gas vesicle protein